jgi:hypothetical protein
VLKICLAISIFVAAIFIVNSLSKYKQKLNEEGTFNEDEVLGVFI